MNKTSLKTKLNTLRRKKQPQTPQRITTETIAEHRERILAGGRRFKYPVQVARHRLVITAVLVASAAILLFIAFILWQLYSVQASNDFVYRVTRVVPLPVANIDGQPVLYSDYLMKYRSSVHYLEQKEQVNINTPDGKREADHVKSVAMQDAVADAYAIKLADADHITVSNSELQLFLAQQRQTSNGTISQSTYDAVILDYYDWSPQEYQHATLNKLLRQKVSYAIDHQASQAAQAAAQQVKAGQTDLKVIADSLVKTDSSVSYGASGLVPLDNQDGGLAQAATKLQVGGVSGIIKPTTGDGYYIIKLDQNNGTQVDYEYVHVALSQFNSQLDALKKAGKLHEYVKVPAASVDSSTSSS